MAAESGSPFVATANATCLRKFVFISAQMLLLVVGLSGCAIPLREGFDSREGLTLGDNQMAASAETRSVKTSSPTSYPAFSDLNATTGRQDA